MKRNKFSLSYTKLFSCDAGELIPAGILEVLPGDSIQMQTRALVRAAPMLAPPMHPVRVRIHHFFVPIRLLWNEWENFITGGPDGLNASVHPFGTTNVGQFGVGSLADYLGVPTAGALGVNLNILPFRAYNLIWNEWYRDADLQTAATINMGSGGDGSTSVDLRNVCWEKDYFTSARPWEQKGAVVTIPLNGAAVLTGQATVREGSVAGPVVNLERGGGGLGAPVQVQQSGQAAGTDFVFDLTSGGATISGAGITVNSLRQSLALQRFQEARARYGSRYVEYLRAIGVRSSDARLQRPEYLGGGVQTIQFSEVMVTAQDSPTTPNPVGTLRGHGISALRSNRYRRFFEEHGYVLTLMSIIPKTIYGDGLFRMWNRTTKYDYWQRELENLGQQAVLNKEVRMTHANPGGVFGYQDRYDEYRRSESSIAGEFRTTLNYWHFARMFASDPVLNSTFVSAVPPERSFAAPNADVFYVHAQHSIQARRMLSQTARPRTF